MLTFGSIAPTMSGPNDPHSPSPFHGNSPPSNLNAGNLPPVPHTDYDEPMPEGGEYPEGAPEGVQMNGPPMAPHHMGTHAYPPGTMGSGMGAPYFSHPPYANGHPTNGGIGTQANTSMIFGQPSQYGQVTQPQGGYNEQRRQSGGSQMLEDDNDNQQNRPEPAPRKATRACDMCRRKKVRTMSSFKDHTNSLRK